MISRTLLFLFKLGLAKDHRHKESLRNIVTLLVAQSCVDVLSNRRIFVLLNFLRRCGSTKRTSSLNTHRSANLDLLHCTLITVLSHKSDQWSLRC